jgi:hypothetical protein
MEKACHLLEGLRKVSFTQQGVVGASWLLQPRMVIGVGAAALLSVREATGDPDNVDWSFVFRPKHATATAAAVARHPLGQGLPPLRSLPSRAVDRQQRAVSVLVSKPLHPRTTAASLGRQSIIRWSLP